MALAPGTKLGAYEITAPLGAGGMGEVYRATDTKLKRQVAIKILPAALAADHNRLARLQREAEVLASLNHPNIAAIYGLEEGDGVTALVMELVEGEDLFAADLARRPRASLLVSTLLTRRADRLAMVSDQRDDRMRLVAQCVRDPRRRDPRRRSSRTRVHSPGGSPRCRCPARLGCA